MLRFWIICPLLLVVMEPLEVRVTPGNVPVQLASGKAGYAGQRELCAFVPSFPIPMRTRLSTSENFTPALRIPSHMGRTSLESCDV
jgi:hypothetical protein